MSGIQSDSPDMLLPVTKITDIGNAYSVTVSANQPIEEKDHYRPDYFLNPPENALLVS